MINRFSNGIVFETRNLPPHNEQVKLPKNKTSSAWFKAKIREFNERQVQVQWPGDDEVYEVYQRRNLSVRNFRCFTKEYDDEDLPREMKEPWHEKPEVLLTSVDEFIMFLFLAFLPSRGHLAIILSWTGG